MKSIARGSDSEMNFGESNASIDRGLAFLERNQLPSGEFKVFRSTDNNLETDCVIDSSPFATALIAYSLGFADSAKTEKMISRCVKFFLAEMEGPGIWRYWTKQHEHHSIIPPDLDDIACVSYVLRRHGVSFPSNEKLILNNRNRNGLFYTWLTPRWPLPASLDYCRLVLPQWLSPLKLYYFWKVNESERHDVDGVVNANVLFYVGESSSTQAVVLYLLDIVRQEREDSCDKWHLNRFTFYYVVARNYYSGISAFESVKDEIVQRILSAANSDGSIGDNVLDTSLAVCALLYWKITPRELHSAIQFLVDQQGADGDWPRAALYYGGPKKYFGWGSEELTTGFVLEALTHYRTTQS